VPFGMVQLSPDTGTDGWQWCSGYNYDDKSIIGFSHTHLSGTGCSDLGDFLFMPTTGAVNLSPGTAEKPLSGYRQNFSHSDEITKAGYYSVVLQPAGIKAELTATERVGVHRYSFIPGTRANIIIDLAHGIGNVPLNAELTISGDHTVQCFRRTRGWASDRSIFCVAEFSKPFESFGTSEQEGKPTEGNRHALGQHVKGWVTFKNDSNEPIVVRVGLSTTGYEGALRNLRAEVKSFNFDAVRNEAKERWNEALNKVRVSPQHESNKDLETFYTALYHCLIAPTLISDVDGKYRASNHEVYTAEGFQNYSTFSLWDTFRAEHPLLTLIQRDRVSDMIKAFQAQADAHPNKTLPIWPLYSNETYCMIGYHSFPVIAEAYAKGIRNWDANALFSLMVHNTAINDYWAQRRYMASDCDVESVSKTLEFGYDDWTLAQFARQLGKNAEYEKFRQRSLGYKTLFDKSHELVHGKLANGEWHNPFNPSDLENKSLDYTEGDAWQYTFFVPHDIQGLIAQMGGRDKFVKQLDRLFTEPHVITDTSDHDITGMIGQYAHGNEPSHHIAYLYCYAGMPSKTQDRVEQIRDGLYSNTSNGLCGNEDCGQMSAWYVFSALGFYPVNPAQATYVFGKPLFHECKIITPSGSTMTIKADALSSKNRYISKVLLNGRELQRVYLTHKELCDGGTLKFLMAPAPDPTWGTSDNAAPPAMLGADEVVGQILK
jgi:predicted alpha-1,2-mannosidase